MTVMLKPDVEDLLQQEMDRSQFQDPSDIIRLGLLALADSRPADMSNFDEETQESIDQADRGELYTDEEARKIIADMRAKL
jgi:Arc/MetJ-type ribon-helix-helix transcriptional regulator